MAITTSAFINFTGTVAFTSNANRFSLGYGRTACRYFMRGRSMQEVSPRQQRAIRIDYEQFSDPRSNQMMMLKKIKNILWQRPSPADGCPVGAMR
jgi:hypothetical protein